MNESLDYQANIGLVHFHAKRGFARAQQAGVPLTYEDMFQEASLAFVLSQRGFDPEAGVKFSAYFTRAAHTQFTKAIGKFTGIKRLNDTMKEEIAERDTENARRRARAEKELPSMRYDVVASNFSDIVAHRESDDGESFEQSLMADCQSPEEIVETKQLMEQAMADLSPLASLILDWLRDPPEAMLAELESQRAHAAVAEEAGVSVRGLDDGISLKNVRKFLTLMGEVTERELVLAEAELRRAVKQIEEAA
jgi:RNA polymerase sigma factor (sigma-70 family)